jgi:gamma-glutamylcysteine synthetase
MCEGARAAGRPSPLVVDKINLAASTQHLRTQGTDVAELSALTQRLIDSQPPQRWCALKSLDEAR